LVFVESVFTVDAESFLVLVSIADKAVSNCVLAELAINISRSFRVVLNIGVLVTVALEVSVVVLIKNKIVVASSGIELLVEVASS